MACLSVLASTRYRTKCPPSIRYGIKLSRPLMIMTTIIDGFSYHYFPGNHSIQSRTSSIKRARRQTVSLASFVTANSFSNHWTTTI